MRRRTFVTGCGVLAGIATVGMPRPVTPSATAESRVQPGPRVQLVTDGRTALRASHLRPHKTYVFAYPFEGTPSFLLDLGKAVHGAEIPLGPAAGAYFWAGGVGKQRSIVAYSAICPHTYAHPTRESAMIHYFGPDEPATVSQRAQVITCCVHGSTFDPSRGAVPLQPPAEIPLAAVLLEWEEQSDALYAVGVVGRPVFEELFRNFPRASRHGVPEVAPVWELERFSQAVLSC